MLLTIIFVLSVLVTIFYCFFGLVPPNFIGGLAVFGVFIGSYVGFVIVALLLFVLFFLIFEKKNPKCMVKHWLLNLFANALYNNILRVKVVVTGLENLPKDNNFVIFCNHIEASDPMYIKQVYKKYPVSFVSKEVLFKHFPVKNILYGIGCIPISPFADRSAAKSIFDSIDVVKSGQPMGIFPEGRRTYSNDIIEFKPGAFKVPMKAKADISPVAVFNMHEIYRKGRILPAKVRLAVLPLLRYDDYKDMDTVTIAQKVYAIILKQMNAFKALEKE
ncbi:MAG: lysophospholipid acyltransferase family protein [Candidatus Izemoplasmatales bacterium]